MPTIGRPREFDEDELVAAATELFWRRGYHETSISDLTDELGILRGSLYGAFGDKHRLFLRALEHYRAEGRKGWADLEAPGPVVPRLRALLAGVLDAARVHPGRGCMLGNTAAELLPHDEAAAHVVASACAELEQAIAEALARGQQTGEIRAGIDPGAHARMLVALFEGLHLIARAQSDPTRLTDAIDAALATLV